MKNSCFSAKLWREDVLDAHLGYNFVFRHNSGIVESGVVTLMTQHTSDSSFHLAVLGGSTSDASNAPFANWPEQLVELAEKNGINLVIHDFAISGCVVAHELIRLIRDVLAYKPDMVISYSGINEPTFTIKKNRFTHTYQKQLFEKMTEKKKGNFFYNLSRSTKVVYGMNIVQDIGVHWYTCEKMMYTICRDNNIKFYAILQPTLYTKKFLSKEEIELLLCNEIDPNNPLCEGHGNEYEKIRKYSLTKNDKWLLDYSDLFDKEIEEIYRDPHHLTCYGNKIVANKFFDLIKDLGEA